MGAAGSQTFAQFLEEQIPISPGVPYYEHLLMGLGGLVAEKPFTRLSGDQQSAIRDSLNIVEQLAAEQEATASSLARSLNPQGATMSEQYEIHAREREAEARGVQPDDPQLIEDRQASLSGMNSYYRLQARNLRNGVKPLLKELASALKTELNKPKDGPSPRL